MSMIITVSQRPSALSGLARCGIVFLAWTAFAIGLLGALSSASSRESGAPFYASPRQGRQF